MATQFPILNVIEDVHDGGVHIGTQQVIGTLSFALNKIKGVHGGVHVDTQTVM